MLQNQALPRGAPGYAKQHFPVSSDPAASFCGSPNLFQPMLLLYPKVIVR
jgi:hypothetical protein